MRSHKRKSSSSSPQDPLPPELWREIFARLPAKTLLKFRSVSKTWSSLIDAPDFISMHLKTYPNNSQNIHLLVLERLSSTAANALVYKVRRRDTLRKTSQLMMMNSQFDIVYRSDMVNGLLLMENCCFFGWDLCLWNPCLKKSVVLPPSPWYFMPGSNQGGCYLGFAPKSFDHKVVAFRSVDSLNGELSVAIYSLFDRIWRVKDDNINVPSWCFQKLMSGCRVVYSRRAIYWRPCPDMGESGIVSFEFDAEEFSFVEMPDLVCNMLRFLFLFGESLAVFGISRERSCIWVMDMVAGKMQWRECFRGDSTSDAYELFASFTDLYTKFLYVEKSGTFLVLSDGKLISYDITSHEITSHQFKHLGIPVHCLYVDTFVDSLVLGVAQRSQDLTLTCHT